MSPEMWKRWGWGWLLTATNPISVWFPDWYSSLYEKYNFTEIVLKYIKCQLNSEMHLFHLNWDLSFIVNSNSRCVGPLWPRLKSFELVGLLISLLDPWLALHVFPTSNIMHHHFLSNFSLSSYILMFILSYYFFISRKVRLKRSETFGAHNIYCLHQL